MTKNIIEKIDQIYKAYSIPITNYSNLWRELEFIAINNNIDIVIIKDYYFKKYCI